MAVINGFVNVIVGVRYVFPSVLSLLATQEAVDAIGILQKLME